MKEVVLKERTMFAGDSQKYRGEGEVLELEDALAKALVKAGKAMEVKRASKLTAKVAQSGGAGGTSVAGGGSPSEKDGKLADGPDDGGADSNKDRPGRSRL